MPRGRLKKPNLTEFEKMIDLIEESKRPAAKKLFAREKFMEETLLELEKQIREEGAIIKAVNGNGFETISEHPAQKSYNTMIGRYSAIMKSIVELLPDSAPVTDELMDFIGGGKR